MGGLGIQDGYLCIPYNGEYIGIRLEYIAIALSILVGLTVVVVVALSGKREDKKP